MPLPTRATVVVSLAATAALALGACGGGGFGAAPSSSAPASQSGPATLRMLVGVSNDVELGAVRKAAEAWAAKTGSTVQVTGTAKLPDELAKGFAGGSPAHLFYLEPAQVGTFAKAGNLYAYGDQLTGLDYVPSLKDTFTIDGKLQCAPKDFSTQALVINEELWAKAGLTDAAAKSRNQAAAVDLVKFLGQDTQQLSAAQAFGVMPSTTSAMAKYQAATPADAAFVAGAEYGRGMPTTPGFDAVIADANAKIESLATGDPKAILTQVQGNAEAALKG